MIFSVYSGFISVSHVAFVNSMISSKKSKLYDLFLDQGILQELADSWLVKLQRGTDSSPTFSCVPWLLVVMLVTSLVDGQPTCQKQMTRRVCFSIQFQGTEGHGSAPGSENQSCPWLWECKVCFSQFVGWPWGWVLCVDWASNNLLS